VFQKIRWKVVHGSRKKPFDLDGNPDHVTLRLYDYGWGVTVRVTVTWVTALAAQPRCVGDNDPTFGTSGVQGVQGEVQ